MEKRLQILLVEDEPFISMDLERLIEEAVPAIVVVKSSVAETRKVLHQDFDFAILDVDVTNGKTYPIAESLGERNIPFVFVSGALQDHLPESLRDVPFIAKPYTAEQIKHAVLTIDDR
jgi:CheY-like chemotaxis protein